MRISKIDIKNHARLQDASLSVRDHLVLVGPNDVGKSSLIRCLDLALGATTAQLYGRITPGDFRDDSKVLAINIRFTALTENEWAAFPDEIDIDPETDEKSLTIRLEASLDTTQTLEVRRTALEHPAAKQLSRAQVATIGWRSIGATSGGDRDFHENRRGALDDVLASVDLRDEREKFTIIQQQMQDAVDGSSALGDVREQLAGQFSRAFPETMAKEDLSFRTDSAVSGDPLAGAELAEEARIFSVMLSRARHGAIVISANRVATQYGYRPKQPSRFLGPLRQVVGLRDAAGAVDWLQNADWEALAAHS